MIAGSDSLRCGEVSLSREMRRGGKERGAVGGCEMPGEHLP